MFSEVGQCSFTAAKKKPFLPFLDTKPFFAMKMINHHDKQLTPSESWDQDGFFEPGFGVSSNSNHEARIFTTLWPPNQGEHLDRLIYKLFAQGRNTSLHPMSHGLVDSVQFPHLEKMFKKRSFAQHKNIVTHKVNTSYGRDTHKTTHCMLNFCP